MLILEIKYHQHDSDDYSPTLSCVRCVCTVLRVTPSPKTCGNLEVIISLCLMYQQALTMANHLSPHCHRDSFPQVVTCFSRSCTRWRKMAQLRGSLMEGFQTTTPLPTRSSVYLSPRDHLAGMFAWCTGRGKCFEHCLRLRGSERYKRITCVGWCHRVSVHHARCLTCVLLTPSTVLEHLTGATHSGILCHYQYCL